MSPASTTPVTTTPASSPAGTGPAPAQRRPVAEAPPPVLLTCEGDLDAPAADRLRARLRDASVPRQRVLLDLSAVTHVSSGALAVLVAAHSRLRELGGSLVVRPSPAVVRVLRISGLHRVVVVDDSAQPAGTTTSSRPDRTS